MSLKSKTTKAKPAAKVRPKSNDGGTFFAPGASTTGAFNYYASHPEERKRATALVDRLAKKTMDKDQRAKSR